MAYVGDHECDACGESSRYTPPYLDVVLEVRKSRGRDRQPSAQYAEVDPLLRAIAERGIVQPPDERGRVALTRALALCGRCAALLGSEEGRGELIERLTVSDRLGPPPQSETGIDPAAGLPRPPGHALVDVGAALSAPAPSAP